MHGSREARPRACWGGRFTEANGSYLSIRRHRARSHATVYWDGSTRRAPDGHCGALGRRLTSQDEVESRESEKTNQDWEDQGLVRLQLEYRSSCKLSYDPLSCLLYFNLRSRRPPVLLYFPFEFSFDTFTPQSITPRRQGDSAADMLLVSSVKTILRTLSLDFSNSSIILGRMSHLSFRQTQRD